MYINTFSNVGYVVWQLANIQYEKKHESAYIFIYIQSQSKERIKYVFNLEVPIKKYLLAHDIQYVIQLVGTYNHNFFILL